MDNETKDPQKQTAPAVDAQPSQAPPSVGSSSKTNVIAIVAIILTFIIPIIGLVLGIIAMVQIKKTKENGRGLALASIIVSSIFILVYIILWFTVFAVIFSADNAVKNAGVDLNSKNNTVTVSKDGNTTQVGSNVSLPDGFPASMPIYPGAKLTSASKTNGTDFSVTATTNDSANKVTDYYKSELVAKGWTIDSSSDSSDTYGTGTSLVVSNGQLTGSVGIYADSKQTTTLLINVYPKM